MSVREHTELLEKRVGVMGPHGQKSELLKLRPYTPCVQILPHEVYLACRIEMINKALSYSIFATQQRFWGSRPGPLLLITELNQFVGNSSNIPVLKDSPLFSGD